MLSNCPASEINLLKMFEWTACDNYFAYGFSSLLTLDWMNIILKLASYRSKWFICGTSPVGPRTNEAPLLDTSGTCPNIVGGNCFYVTSFTHLRAFRNLLLVLCYDISSVQLKLWFFNSAQISEHTLVFATVFVFYLASIFLPILYVSSPLDRSLMHVKKLKYGLTRVSSRLHSATHRFSATILSLQKRKYCICLETIGIF